MCWGTVSSNFTLKNVNNDITYWSGPISLQKTLGAVLHERFHIIGSISGKPNNFIGLPDRGTDVKIEGHNNMLWSYDMMYHNGSHMPTHSLYGFPPLLSHDMIFLGWIKPNEILEIDSSNYSNYLDIKLTDINYPLDSTQINQGYRKIVKVMIKENYSENYDEYFLIEYHNASEFDKAFENYAEYPITGYNTGVLIWHIKERTNMLNWGSDNLITLKTAVPYNGYYGNPIPEDDYPRDYNRPDKWNGIYNKDYNYLDDNLFNSNNQFYYLPDGGMHIWETTVINDTNNKFTWDPTGERRFYRLQSLSSDFFTNEAIKGHITNKMTDATRPSTKEWGRLLNNKSSAEKTHIAITDINKHNGYMTIRVHYNYWAGEITENSTMSGNVTIEGNLTVAPNVTLSIFPGTTIEFSNGTSIIVNGNLSASGTTNDQITLTNSSGTWGGIIFMNGSSGNLNYCNLKNIKTYGGAAISIINSSPTIQNCTIENLDISSGIYIYGSAITPYIYNNTIRNGNYHGIYINRGNAYIRDNHIYGFTSSNKAGVYSYDFSTPLFAAPAGGYEAGLNVIENNYYGIYAGYHTYLNAGAESNAYQNFYYNNSAYNAYAQSYSTIYAKKNYWNPKPPEKIYSDATSVIYYYPFYKETPYPPPNKVTNNLFNEGLTQARDLLFNKQYKEAFQIYQNLINNYSNEEFVFNIFSDLYYMSINSSEVDLPNYLNTLTQNSLLNKQLKDKANETLALIYENSGNAEQFKQISEMLISNCAGTEIEKNARLNLFFHYYQGKDYSNAIKYLTDFPEEFIDENYKIALWLLNISISESENFDIDEFISKEKSKEIEKITSYELSQNYPNPFNPTTTINYQIPKAGFVSLKVYDILGREVAVLVNGEKEIGRYTVLFDGSKLASGVYIYELRANEFVSMKKLMLVK